MSHNCSTCEIANDCPIKHIAPWLNEHESEELRARENQADQVVKAVKVCYEYFPLAILGLEDITKLASAAFSLGYYEGRNFQDVPQVFKDS